MIVAKEKDKYKILLKSGNLREMQQEAENLTWDFVFARSVIDKKYFKKSRSGQWGNVPEGFFVVSKPGKYTIYEKKIKAGYLFNRVVIKKHISFFIIEPEGRIFENIERGNYFDACEQKQRLFFEIHEEVAKKLLQAPESC
jgi:hypothetical protein